MAGTAYINSKLMLPGWILYGCLSSVSVTKKWWLMDAKRATADCLPKKSEKCGPYTYRAALACGHAGVAAVFRRELEGFARPTPFSLFAGHTPCTR